MELFNKEVYWQRRKMLKEQLGDGILLFPGNDESSMNYPANTYHYRQDSSFLYFFGINAPGFYGVCDLDSDEDILFGIDFEMDDIIWMGEQPKVRELAERVGIQKTATLAELSSFLQKASEAGRRIHLLPTYRGDQVLKLSQLLNIPYEGVSKMISQELIGAVVKLRSIKDQYEIAEIDKAADIAYLMHTTAMKMAYPGNFERELAGAVEGISISHGGPVSFPVILSMDGQTLHNHYHGNELVEGRMVVCDAGAETAKCYASDITRTFPVGGTFSRQQKDIYNIVLKANMDTIAASGPGKSYRELHLMAAGIIAGGLKDLGIMKGNMEEAVAAGAHALFFPHGLGHMLGMDVHDMEGLGENNVGYNESIRRSEQFGLAYLRLGRKLEPGFVVTNEPGCYFIPALIDQWKAGNKFTEFINYDEVEKYRGFGGVRIEDDILITENGMRVLGTPIPKTVEEVEQTMKS